MAVNILIYSNTKKNLELISENFRNSRWLVHGQYGDP